jgi:hypothetical protein
MCTGGKKRRGISEPGERQVRYGRQAPVYEADVEADAEPVDESGMCKAESECGAWRASGWRASCRRLDVR